FSGNYAGIAGGGMFNEYSSPTLTNVTFGGNSADHGGGLFNYFSSPTLTNCILWGDSGGEIGNNQGTPTVSYSDVQGGRAGARPKTTNPARMFVDARAGTLRLQYGSPAVGTGTSSGAPATDLDGNPRPAGGPTDMGAYQQKVLFVNQAATGTNDGSSWT